MVVVPEIVVLVADDMDMDMDRTRDKAKNSMMMIENGDHMVIEVTVDIKVKQIVKVEIQVQRLIRFQNLQFVMDLV